MNDLTSHIGYDLIAATKTFESIEKKIGSLEPEVLLRFIFFIMSIFSPKVF